MKSIPLSAGGGPFSSIDEVQRWAIALALGHGLEVAPRGLLTLEVIGGSFVLLEPRARCLTIPERRWSLPLAIGEFCWHLAGADDADTLAYYAPRWREFSDDGSTIRGSCYGQRIFGSVDGQKSQWERLVELLRS